MKSLFIQMPCISFHDWADELYRQCYLSIYLLKKTDYADFTFQKEDWKFPIDIWAFFI